MSTIAGIRAGIQTKLAAHYTTWNIGSYLLASPAPPQLDIVCGAIDYDTAMRRGNDDITFIVRALVQWGELDSSQALLDTVVDLTGTDSVKTVLEADPTLGGACSAVRVSQASELKVYDPPGGSAIPGVEFTVLVTP